MALGVSEERGACLVSDIVSRSQKAVMSVLQVSGQWWDQRFRTLNLRVVDLQLLATLH